MPLSTPVCDQGILGFHEMLSAERASGAWAARGRLSRVADMAASGDVGFVAGAQVGGSYVTLMSRSSSCVWQVLLDESVQHPPAPAGGPELVADSADWAKASSPAQRLLAHDAAGIAMTEFRKVLGQEGLAAALRTYGRNNDFRLYLEGNVPFEGVDAANNHLIVHAIDGQLQERSRERSADGTFTYSVGTFQSAHRQGACRCFQLWQYDAKVANWGVRVLLLSRTQSPA